MLLFYNSVTSNLIIDLNKQTRETRIALLEDGNLVEFRSQRQNASFSVGDIYLGVVRKVMLNHNAAFVDIGFKKEGFLHLKDLGLHYAFMASRVKQSLREGRALSVEEARARFTFRTDSPEAKEALASKREAQRVNIASEQLPKITDLVKSGQTILVQIAREPYSNKGPSLTTEISLAGRNMVLLPFSDRVLVSSKISSKEEMARLKRLMRSILPAGFGVIVRTAAEGMQVAPLDAELNELLARWDECLQVLHLNPKPPCLLHSELKSSSALLRDNLNGSYTGIHVNDRQLFQEIKSYLNTIAPQKQEIVKFYSSTRVPIFDAFQVSKQLKKLLGQMVVFHGGSYLIIQHPEAFHVIDVNSGSGAKSARTPEETALEVNLAACDEIARQLRLRDMGGIIVIDFIDMATAANRKMVYDRMRELMANDKVTHRILEITDFGLMQITRQRHRPEERIDTTEKCPCCQGSGRVASTIALEDEIERKLQIITEKGLLDRIELRAHPFVAAYYNKGILCRRRKVAKALHCKLRVEPDESYNLLDYKFFDFEGNEVSL